MLIAKAVSFEEVIPQKVGACEPLVVSVIAQNNTGEPFPAYMKLTDKLPLGIRAYIPEAIASLLAADLKLLTPEPLAIEIDEKFIASIDDAVIQSRLEGSHKLAFATKKLPNGFFVPPTDFKLSTVQLKQASDIFCFDALIENPDRGGAGKPNCLIGDDKIAIIDHEKAFSSANGILLIGAKKLWELGGLDHFSQPDSHLFVNQLLKSSDKIEFKGFAERWCAISDDRLEAYMQALPTEWLSDITPAQKMLEHIRLVRENIDGCVTELNRIFGKTQ